MAQPTQILLAYSGGACRVMLKARFAAALGAAESPATGDRTINKKFCSIALTLMLLGAPAQGGVQEFTDKDEWIAAVGEFTTIDFTGFDVGTFITDQYADLGILFTDGNDSIQHTASFLNDEWGLDGNGDIRVAFDTPQLWIGVDFPGGMKFELFSEGRLIFTSFDFVPGGVGNFFGLVSNNPFDAALLIDPVGEAAIDDLHFGVPAPGTLALFALGAFVYRRRRR